MFVGRFLGFKRVPLLVRAYARARARMSVPAPLVIWGGAPGEWEGEHPHTRRRRGAASTACSSPAGAGTTTCRSASRCADCFVAPSTDEPFGLVYLEAMACGLPVIGTLSGGPPSFVNVVAGEPDGWLVPPDDEEALAGAIARRSTTPPSALRRGANAARARPRQLLVGTARGPLHRALRARRPRVRQPAPCRSRAGRLSPGA